MLGLAMATIAATGASAATAGYAITDLGFLGNGAFQELNDLIPAGSGYSLINATSINHNGQFVAIAHPGHRKENAHGWRCQCLTGG